MGRIKKKFKIQRKKEWRKEKEEIFTYAEGPIQIGYPLVENALGLPSLWRTHSYGDLPYNFMQAPRGFHLVCLYFSPVYVWIARKFSH